MTVPAIPRGRAQKSAADTTTAAAIGATVRSGTDRAHRGPPLGIAADQRQLGRDGAYAVCDPAIHRPAVQHRALPGGGQNRYQVGRPGRRRAGDIQVQSLRVIAEPDLDHGRGLVR